MSAEPRRESPTRRFERKREVILEAAARVFNRDGLHGGTLSAVAAEVGLISNSITYYYRHKEDLAAACLLRAVDVVKALLVVAEREPDPAERVRAFVRGWAQLLAEIAEGRQADIITFNEMVALPEKPGQAVFGAYVELFRSVRRLLPHHETLSRRDRNARAYLLIALVLWMRAWLSGYEARDYRRVADDVADVLLDGLAAHAGQWREQDGPEIGWPRVAAGEGATREAFLRVATALVNDHGYRGASVERIAGQLNLTKGSFYHHLESKDELILACFERSFDVVRQTQDRAAERPGDTWDRLTALVRSLVRFQLSEQGPLLRITARNALPVALRDERLHAMNRLTSRFGLAIVDGLRDGSVRPVNPAVAAQLVAGMVNGAAELKRWVPGITLDSAASLYAQPLFVGLRAPGAH